MNWYLDVLKKYAVFEGRARRKEYWMFVLINIIVLAILAMIDTKLFGAPSFLYGVYSLGVLLPAIGVAIRRLHDTGRTGWWLLLALLPLIGHIVLFIFMVLDSQPGSNEHGPNPKGAAA